MIKTYMLSFPEHYEIYDFIKEFDFGLLSEVNWRYMVNYDDEAMMFIVYGAEDTDWNGILNTFKSYVQLVIMDDVVYDEVRLTNELTETQEGEVFTKLAEFSVLCIKNDMVLGIETINTLFMMRYEESMQTIDILRGCVDMIREARTLNLVERIFENVIENKIKEVEQKLNDQRPEQTES